MKIYDYGKTKNCLICGNVDGNIDKFIKTIVNGLLDLKSFVTKPHPKELERSEKLAMRVAQEARGVEIPGAPFDYTRTARKISRKTNCGYNLTDSLIIVDGYNGFGERDLKYYYDKLEMLNKALADNNTHILFVRGNDDPKYFEDELINLSNIKTIQDYAVIKLNKFNCLCIGGCVSLDRTWRMEQEKRIGRKMYWDGENLRYDEEEIKKIIKDYNIACVVTASSPSFAFPRMNYFKQTPWAFKDKSIDKDMSEERMFMDRIYNTIVENDKKPYIWVYSKFKEENQNTINDILFKSLNTFQFFHFNDAVSTLFNIDFSIPLGKNEGIYNLNKKVKKFSPFINNPFTNNNLDIDDMLDGGEEAEQEEMEDADDGAEPTIDRQEEGIQNLNRWRVETFGGLAREINQTNANYDFFEINPNPIIWDDGEGHG